VTEYFETGSKIGRGMAQKSLDLIEAMCTVIKAAALPLPARVSPIGK
jgi:hypothetical protein